MGIQKDLHSLKSLYRILQTTGKDIDEAARLLFKNLLDAARDNFLLTTSKIIATGQSMSGNSTAAVHSNVHMHTSPKLKERSIMMPLSPQAVSEKNRKKRCRVCQQTNLARLIEDASHGDEAASDFSKQVSNSIKLVDSTILSLQLVSDVLNPVQLQSSKVRAAQTSKRNWAENTQSNESPVHHYVHGLRIPLIPDNNRTRAAGPSHITCKKDSLIQPNNNIGKLAKCRPSTRPQLDFNRTIWNKASQAISRQNEHLYTAQSHNRNPVMPTLLDYESPTKLPSAGQHQKATLPNQQESDVQSAISSSTSSYNWRNQPETETETETSSLMTPENSIEESRSNSSVYSSADSYKDTASSWRKTYRRNPDKAIGRLRRFKNKLGLIFHHHHHHHHHHHQGETNTRKDKSSIWKQLGKIFHHKDQQRIYEKKAAGTLKKLSVSKKQAGQFQALVKGVMKHVKHSKKSKLSKGGLQPRYDNKHWWQMFKCRRSRRPRAVKLSNGGRIRIQFKSKKPKLRALRN